MEGRISISLAIFILSFFTFVTAFEGVTRGGKDTDPDVDLDKRPYEIGKKPSSHYVNEYKRLPIYNFGLGKRSSKYNFGLGKRSFDDIDDFINEYVDDDDDDNNNNNNNNMNDDYSSFIDDKELPEMEIYFDDELQLPEKRQKLYSIGFGKRLPKYDFGLGKRFGPYDFGLGKRMQRYNFGLGKRNGLYSFGLGKKNVDQLSNRYSFGLGKRSSSSSSSLIDMDLDELERNKREVNMKDLDDLNNNNINNNNNNNNIKKETNHDLGKRSRNSVIDFSRRYRKPFSYNFGLGKRRPLYDFGLGKRNYQNIY